MKQTSQLNHEITILNNSKGLKILDEAKELISAAKIDTQSRTKTKLTLNQAIEIIKIQHFDEFISIAKNYPQA